MAAPNRRSPDYLYVLKIVCFCALLLVLSCAVVKTSNGAQGTQTLFNKTDRACREVRYVAIEDQCRFVQKYCDDEDDGYISYLSLYYCQLAHVKPIAIIIILAWIAFLFSSLGVVAGDFLAVNLSSIAHDLRISDTLAGVTFLALANGAPDIFSTVAAMSSASENLALGELLGAAAFISSVVAGSMALIRPFAVVKAAIIRDSLFLLVTVIFLIYILIDGHLRLWHCIAMILYYVLYICVVSAWHYWSSRQKLASKSHDRINQDQAHKPTGTGRASGETEPLLSRSDPVDGADRQPQPTEPSPVSREPYTYWDGEALFEEDARSMCIDYLRVNQSLLSTLHDRHQRRMEERTHQNSRQDTDITQSGGQQHNEDENAAIHTADLSSNDRGSLGSVLDVLFPIRTEEKGQSNFYLLAYIIMIPTTLCLKLTVPVVVIAHQADHDDDGQTSPDDCGEWHRWLTIIHCFTAPQFFLWAFIADQLSLPVAQVWKPALVCAGVSVLASIGVFVTSSSDRKPRWHRLLCIPGFIVSIAWISTIADEMVAILTALGAIANISEAILGITVFAIGNSMDDLAANISVTQRKHPVMALGACFAGPLLNILIGISVSTLPVIIKSSHSKQKLVEIELDSPKNLFVTAGMIIVTIISFLSLMLITKWRMTRFVGFALIGIWIAGTVVNVVMEVKG